MTSTRSGTTGNWACPGKTARNTTGSRRCCRPGKVTTPTIFLGGRDDWNVPLLNAELFYQSLRKRGIDTELVVYPGTHHGGWTDEFERDPWSGWGVVRQVPEVSRRRQQHLEPATTVEPARGCARGAARAIRGARSPSAADAWRRIQIPSTTCACSGARSRCSRDPTKRSRSCAGRWRCGRILRRCTKTWAASSRCSGASRRPSRASGRAPPRAAAAARAQEARPGARGARARRRGGRGARGMVRAGSGPAAGRGGARSPARRAQGGGHCDPAQGASREPRQRRCPAHARAGVLGRREARVRHRSAVAPGDRAGAGARAGVDHARHAAASIAIAPRRRSSATSARSRSSPTTPRHGRDSARTTRRSATWKRAPPPTRDPSRCSRARRAFT